MALRKREVGPMKMTLALGICLLSLVAGPLQAPALAAGGAAEKVDLALVLAADVSRSIDSGEFDLQRQGYAKALSDPRVLRAIVGGRHHAIAVTFVEWAGPEDQNTVVDWTVVRDEETAGIVAAAMRAAPRSFVGRTAIGSAIDFARQRLAAAPVEAEKRVIDVSGDGTSNSGRPVTDARDEAVAGGITINGLAIINNKLSPAYSFHTHPPGGLPKYYEDHVIGGTGAFLIQIEDFDSFADAITRKLVAEIAAARPFTTTAALR
jgi:hypothetical protein